MKRTSAFIMALLLCLAFSFTVFADDIFIIEDGEDEFIADAQITTTTQPAETTTAASGYENIFDSDKLSGYVDSIKDMFGDGIDSVMDGLDSWGNQMETTTAVSSTSPSPPKVDAGSYTPSNQSSAMTTYASTENTTVADTEPSTQVSDIQPEDELPSVLIISDTENDSWGISGSTLTLLVFVAAIVILILVVVIVLIIMTRRTEFNSAVKPKSTLPGVEQPDSLAQFIENDDMPDDGKDYGNITYWDDNSGS